MKQKNPEMSAPISVEQNQTNNKIVNQNVSFKSEINDLILNITTSKGKNG